METPYTALRHILNREGGFFDANPGKRAGRFSSERAIARPKQGEKRLGHPRLHGLTFSQEHFWDYDNVNLLSEIREHPEEENRLWDQEQEE